MIDLSTGYWSEAVASEIRGYNYLSYSHRQLVEPEDVVIRNSNAISSLLQVGFLLLPYKIVTSSVPRAEVESNLHMC